MIEICVGPAWRRGYASRRKKALILGVRRLVRGQFEGIEPHAMRWLLVIAPRLASHPTPLFRDPNHHRFDESRSYAIRSIQVWRCSRHAHFLDHRWLVSWLKAQLLDAPVEKFGHEKFVLAGAGDFMDPAKLAKLFAGLAENTENLSVESQFVNAAWKCV